MNSSYLAYKGSDKFMSHSTINSPTHVVTRAVQVPRVLYKFGGIHMGELIPMETSNLRHCPSCSGCHR